MGTKVCRYCHEEKDIDDFSRNHILPDGRSNQCRECRKLYNKKHFSKAQERVQKLKDAFYALSWKEMCTIVQYLPDEGILIQNGKPVTTSVDSQGYVHAYINKHHIVVHRLAFFLMTKRWPDVVDHIDGNKGNNMWCNLRELDARGNSCNKKEHRNGKLLGAIYAKKSGKWQTQITIADGKRKSLGMYSTEYDAALVYARYSVKHNLLPRDMFKFTDEELQLC